MEIVGLKQKVDNDVNKLIAKFVGFPASATANIINECIREYREDGNDWDFLKHAYINYMIWEYCSDCHHKMEYRSIMSNGGHCPHCDIHRYDFTTAESFTIRMKYRWRDPHRWKDHHFQIYGERPPRE